MTCSLSSPDQSASGNRQTRHIAWVLGLMATGLVGGVWSARGDDPYPLSPVALNRRDTGYRGIWYMNQPSGDEYVYKYSGGLGTYCAHHQPFAVHCPQVEKTFFCYGGATADDHRRLLHMVSYFDHRTGTVPRPTLLLDKQTSDAHDNPVIAVDAQGYLWIFSTSHGTSRPSYVHRSREPYSVAAFDLVPVRRREGDALVPITNFSYFQAWHIATTGFVCFFTRYDAPAARTLYFMSSPDGVTWDAWQCLAAIEEGHYQVSAVGRTRIGSTFNVHPQGRGLNWRTNLYYLESPDLGRSWQTVDGQPLTLPLSARDNPALVHDYAARGLNVYLIDLQYDANDRPVILYLTSRGYEPGPLNDPRTWTTARWTGMTWDLRPAFTSDSNYDMGSLWIEPDGEWRIIAPSETGPQPYNPGGEVALWVSRDQGASWQKQAHLTSKSPRNHTYVRRPVRAHPDFYAFWADGHAREPSLSRLYVADRDGNVGMLPGEMSSDREPLIPLSSSPQPQ
jgi:hypothetical protein